MGTLFDRALKRSQHSAFGYSILSSLSAASAPRLGMVNALLGEAGLKFGPILFETLIKHYFEHLSKEKNALDSKDDHYNARTKLQREKLLYDEAFSVIKVGFEPYRRCFTIFNECR